MILSHGVEPCSYASRPEFELIAHGGFMLRLDSTQFRGKKLNEVALGVEFVDPRSKSGADRVGVLDP